MAGFTVGVTVMVNVCGTPLQPVPVETKPPMDSGLVPTFTVEVTAWVLVSMMETLFESWLVTYNLVLSWFNETPTGLLPTAIVVETELVVVLITETLFAPLFTT